MPGKAVIILPGQQKTNTKLIKGYPWIGFRESENLDGKKLYLFSLTQNWAFPSVTTGNGFMTQKLRILALEVKNGSIIQNSPVSKRSQFVLVGMF